MKENWREWLRSSYHIATFSRDPSTQNGAILIGRDGSLMHHMGRPNNFPEGVKESPERWERPLKYKYVEHAERAIILSAAKQGWVTEGSTMICGWACCADCARAIIGAGVKRLVTHKQALDRSPPNWAEEIKVAFAMLAEAGVDVVIYDGVVGGSEVRHSGAVWEP